MRCPIAFVSGNCVFAAGLNDPWAAFEIELASYAWLTKEGKNRRFVALLGAIEAIEADIQLLRVSRRWDPDDYLGEMQRERERELFEFEPDEASQAEPHGDGNPLPAHGLAASRYARQQAKRLAALAAVRPRLFLLVSLREPRGDVSSFLSTALAAGPASWRIALASALETRGRRLLGARELERINCRAEQVELRLSDYLSVRAPGGAELQWLVRRAFCRGLGEPAIDPHHAPRALAFERNGSAVLAPLEADLARWLDSYVDHRRRLLMVESELGASWQAHLVAGALPDTVDFPGADAELMFRPVEALPFPVDLCLTARFLPNGLAVRMARRRVQDADQIARAESGGEQGASDQGLARMHEARDLLAHLQRSSRPPLLRGVLSIAVGADSEELLERRVELCRRAFGEVRLHRPLGDQLQLFVQHLPGQRTRVTGYDDTFTTEQVAAMMPHATHAVGSAKGFYLGHVLSASEQPVRFNLREGSQEDRNTAVLSLGALGTGKTTLAQKLQYEAFLQGARIVDCDPKGDHRFHLLEDVEPHVELVPLRPEPALGGMLDPLRVAPAHLRQDATVSFLRALLPARAEPAWETAVLRAVDRVIARSRQPTCLEVVRMLAGGDATDVEVARTLEVHARSGLTQLGFADNRRPPPSVGKRQVTYLPIRDLPSPAPGAARSEYSQSERVGEQVVRLIAMLALRLMSSERERLKVFSFDEGWRLLGDPVGRSLLGSLQRMGRSELAVPIISTQLVTDALIGERESIEHLVGATFVFGVRSRVEAGRALTLLGLDSEDRALQQTLLELEAGRCLFRDHRGRIEAIQVDVVVPSLLRAFSTTPVQR